MKRLEFISSLTKGYKSICDIGSDHGYVCIDAVKSHKVLKAYALDINEGPLANAYNNIKAQNLSDKIEVILSDGLKSFNYDVDLYLICGMGGNLACKILDDSLDKFKKAKSIIIEPNNYEHMVRKYLMDHNFYIKCEYIIKDSGHFYEIIEASYGKKEIYDDLDIMFGPFLRREKSEVFIEKYNHKLEVLKENIKSANENNVLTIKNKIDLIEEVIYGK